MTRGLSLAPHLTFDATQTTAEDAVKEIVKLRPEGYVGWDGVDGTFKTPICFYLGDFDLTFETPQPSFSLPILSLPTNMALT